MRLDRLTYKQSNCETQKMFQFIRELNMLYANDDRDDMPVYKSFEFIDTSHELKGFEENERTNLKLNTDNKDEVPRNKGGDEGFMDWKDSLHRTGFPESPTCKSEESDVRKKIYVKRDVEDCDMPEMVAFFQDSNYNLFKDVFMDKESVCQDESVIEDYELDRYNLSSVCDNDDTESNDSIKATLERLSCIANELQLAEDDSTNEQSLSKRFLMEDDEGYEEEIDDVSNDVPAETIHLIKHDIKNKQHGSKRLAVGSREDFDKRSTTWNDSPAEKLLYTSYKRLTVEEEEDFDGRDNIWIDDPDNNILHNNHQIKEILSKESSSSNSLLSSTTEAEDYNCATSNTNYKSEEKSTCNNTEAAASIQGAAKDCRQVLETVNPESGMSESLKRSNQRLNNQDYDGECSSIEAEDPPSGPISIRSSSSTASACSFAFPILASEWPGSPVRMARAEKEQWSPVPVPVPVPVPMPIGDRRKSQREWRWRALVCCKSFKVR